MARRRYFSRLSGPLLDRIDLQVEVLPVTRTDRASTEVPERTAVVAARVVAARARARRRLSGTPWTTNAEVPGGWLRRHTEGADARRDLERALDTGMLSLRGLDRVLRVAWTLADLGDKAGPGDGEIGQALLLRTRGQAL